MTRSKGYPMIPEYSNQSACTAARRYRVLIADNNPIVRSGLAAIISEDIRFEVIGDVASGQAFFDIIGLQRVDIGVIGWSLVGMRGADVLTKIKKEKIPTRIVVSSGVPTPEILKSVMRAGAYGLVTRVDEPHELIGTLLAVSRGCLCFPFVDIQMIKKDQLDMLTVRERQLLEEIANGGSNRQIAQHVGISKHTVKYHLRNLYQKLGVSNRAAAVAFFFNGGSRKDACLQ